VEERRGEAFAMASWRLNAQWTIEGGSRFESSQLVQSGDSNDRKSFFFAKPRALVSFAPAQDSQWRLLLERRVGQLDFEDFVSSTSLSADTVTAGNPDLEPDRTWVAELAWERHFMKSGSLVLTVRREEIADLIDRIPVAGPVVFDGVGNIGDAVREEFEMSINLPLEALGLASARLKATALWRNSRATDPATGESRAISEDAPFEAALHFTQDMTRWNTHLGIDVEFATETPEFMFDEIRSERLGSMVNIFAEYEPAPAWNIRLYANNLADRSTQRERRIFDGVRGGAPLIYVETRTLRIGPYVGLSVRRTFGD
ncbi:MAG: TonB-dependent receptor, partial [Steroidobacter sp.]